MSAQQVSTKAAVTVTEMASQCELSRSRFYSLMQAGVFPAPVQKSPAKRPVYIRELIEKCLEIRRTGVGLDGRIIVFNRKRRQPSLVRPRQRVSPAATPQDSPFAPVIAGLKSLGLIDVNDAQVEPIVSELFPGGINGHDLGEVIRRLFLALKKKQ